MYCLELFYNLNIIDDNADFYSEDRCHSLCITMLFSADVLLNICGHLDNLWQFRRPKVIKYERTSVFKYKRVYVPARVVYSCCFCKRTRHKRRHEAIMCKTPVHWLLLSVLSSTFRRHHEVKFIYCLKIENDSIRFVNTIGQTRKLTEQNNPNKILETNNKIEIPRYDFEKTLKLTCDCIKSSIEVNISQLYTTIVNFKDASRQGCQIWLN